MPLASNAFLIKAYARRRMTNCSPGLVIILRRMSIAKSLPNCSTPCIFSLDDVRRQLRVGLQVLADLLDDLLHLVEIGVVGDADAQLVDHPVAAHVLDRAQLPERHRRGNRGGGGA